jgi:hypothetical protein
MGLSCAGYAFNIDAAAKNGEIRENIYRRFAIDFNIGTSADVVISGNINDP